MYIIFPNIIGYRHFPFSRYQVESGADVYSARRSVKQIDGRDFRQSVELYAWPTIEDEIDNLKYQ